MNVTAYLPINSSKKAKDTTLHAPGRFGDKGLLSSAVCTGVTRPLACLPFRVNPKRKFKKDTEKEVGFVLAQVSTTNQLKKKIKEERAALEIEKVVEMKRGPIDSKSVDIGVKKERRPAKHIFNR